jgi:hypothetical protein
METGKAQRFFPEWHSIFFFKKIHHGKHLNRRCLLRACMRMHVGHKNFSCKIPPLSV